MKILFVGCGSIGKKHIRNLSKFKGIKILACRVRGKDRKFEKKYQVKVYKNLKAALREKPNAVFVTNPTSMHVQIALKAAKAGAHLFIEKPISHKLSGIKNLENIVKKKRLKVFVGYNMRFLWGLRKLREIIKSGKIGKVLYINAVAGQYLPDWRPNQDYRKSYSAKKKMGGGVILDLSHEIDYVRWLVGEAKEVFARTDKISNLQIDTEDVADISLKFKNGTIGNIHLDYLQRTPQRYCEIFGTKGSAFWDLYYRCVCFFDSTRNRWYSYTAPQNDMEKTYEEEMKHFLNVLRGKEKSSITLEDGKKVLEIVLAAKKGRIVKLK